MAFPFVMHVSCCVIKKKVQFRGTWECCFFRTVAASCSIRFAGTKGAETATNVVSQLQVFKVLPGDKS